MRPDTEAAIERLSAAAQVRTRANAAALEALESRLAPERPVHAAFQTVGGPRGGDRDEQDLGLLMITGDGFHWVGERSGRLDVPWSRVVRHEVVTIRLSMFRRRKVAFRLEVETAEYSLQFRLEDEAMAAVAEDALRQAPPR